MSHNHTVKNREQILSGLKALFVKWTGRSPGVIITLPPSGSYRQYFRLVEDDITAIGVYNPDLKENRAFLEFTKHFGTKGLPVPSILAEDREGEMYLQQDLGKISLHDLVMQGELQDQAMLNLYKRVLDALVRFQLDGIQGLDTSLFLGRPEFDQQAVYWDLNYFKYMFCKVARVPFDEQLLEEDFAVLSRVIEGTSRDYFMFRDFQSRNIMVVNDEPWFIDYQGGKKGALAYDLASFLWEAKTSLSQENREILLNYYLDVLGKRIQVNKEDFKKEYYYFVLVRILQAMGAYGLRGLVEKKAVFVQSIPKAIKNLSWIKDHIQMGAKMPELARVIDHLSSRKDLEGMDTKRDKLVVSVKSFSYMKGLPEDYSGNGGGFIFDCRFIHNPGRYDEHKAFTGRDQQVKDFFRDQSTMHAFTDKVFSMVSEAVEVYIDKNFHSLQVNFGCTGGQHRSVYAAEQIAGRIAERFPVEVHLLHRELGIEQKFNT